MDFGAFSTKNPENWTYKKQRGIDLFIGKIAFDEKDTLPY